MLAASSKFLRAVRTSGQRKTVIHVTESFGAAYIFENIPILDGTLTIDRNSDVRRTATIRVGEKSLTDIFFTNNAGPFGMEIEIHSGVVFPDGSEELLKMGVFNIEDFSWEEGDEGWPTLQLMDRAQWIHRADFVSAKDYSGKFVQAAITQIITEVLPTVDIEFEAGLTNPRLPGGSVYDGRRWDVVKACAASMGAEAYFDAEGVLQIITAKDPTAIDSDTSWEVNVGEGFSEVQGDEGAQQAVVNQPPGVLISANRSVSRAETHNAVVVYGAAPAPTVGQPFALVFDNDPTSSTYYYGAFGKSVKRVDSQVLTSATTCTAAALAELKKCLGLARSLDFQAVANPALEAGDYGLFTFSDQSQEVHLLDSCTHPLFAGNFVGSTRTTPMKQTNSVGIKKGTNVFDLLPGPPGQPQVISATNNSLTVRFTAASKGANDLVRYEILINDSYHQAVAASTASTYTAVVPGLLPGRTYMIDVRAVDSAGLTSTLSARGRGKTTGTYDPGDIPVPVKDYEKRYVANWTSNYNGAGDRINSLPECYQGIQPGGGTVNWRSLIGFNDQQIREDLDGANIVSCQLKLHFSKWANDSGTAVIGTHVYDTVAGHWFNASVNEDRIRSTAWKEGTSRAVWLGSSIGEEFRTGASKGIAIGPAPSGGSTYFGIAQGMSSGSLTPTLIINYRK